ncbi:MAG: tetratricopeptide repeat protein [Planctomycetota bacterium]|jgi:cell division protein FtsL
MTEDKIQNLLYEADQMAGGPAPISANLAAAVRRRANRRQTANLAVHIAAAAVVLLALGIWSYTAKKTRDRQRIVALEMQIKQLQTQTDATLDLIREVLDEERKQRHLDDLRAQLAGYPDPLEEIQKQVDKTAFILIYQANRMYRELDQKDSAIQAYNRVIELFPQSRWAEEARKTLSEIQNNQHNNSKGDLI